ncbi:hypothetical protein HZU73_09395 [Apis mellifera caucasica]|nr:hypothetical protein HZU73_09395 [Apis mellifera caucasica]
MQIWINIFHCLQLVRHQKRLNVIIAYTKERRRWARPPLIGQSSNTESSSRYVQTPLSNLKSPSPDLKHNTPETILEEKNENQEILTEAIERKISSPTSSIASHKPLEWDSGADVGYFNTIPNSKQNDKKLSTIERMALAKGCSAALRLDPEGTTESGISGKLAGVQKNSTNSMIPDANSTPLLGNASGSESEIEITPIVKNHLPGIISGNGIKSNERFFSKDLKHQNILMQYSKREYNYDTPKSTFASKIPFAKFATEVRKVSSKQNTNKENICPPSSPLKKSTSMNTLFIPPSKLPLKRSQSELNLYGRDKGKSALPLIFNSSSSIATIVNKPSTCDKVIQTTLYAYTQESVGVQVSALEEEKPPLPKRGTSLRKGSTLMLKNPKDTYKVQNSRNQKANEAQNAEASGERKGIKLQQQNYSGQSQNESARQTPQPDTEDVTGRANSFEYFPGHVYENVPNGSGSHISSSETGRSHSTLPNTSSSINEKLWGDSDSLVKDLERSVNILKSLVDANKCDKEIKKRLIHHVVKRLITAKYTDDKIEHNLEDNVPWNPDDARSKVYGREILQAITKNHNTSDSSADWNLQKELAQRKSTRSGKGMGKNVTSESSSDKVDKNTDRTETDGRKARMGLRSDDCHRSSNTMTDKSESSECFFPQRGRKGNKMQDIFCTKDCKMQRDSKMTTTRTTTMTTATTNNTIDHNRMLLDAVVNNRRNVIRSSNTGEQDDWRLLTTFSERQFEMKKHGNSDSADSKLVSYAEMEKRNQLIWITNEISHLCNLKKLLEESRRPERLRTSPKKSRSGNFKRKPMETSSHELSKNDYCNCSDTRVNSLEDPWSSHCNLACHHSSTSTSIIQHIKKRNSCAQTATNITGALSKTGGEIVSVSNLHNFSIKLVSIGVQTIPQETSTIPALIQSEIVHYVKCPAHSSMQFQNNHKCTEQISQCVKHHAIQNLVTCTQCSQEQKERLTVQKVHTNIENFQEESPVSSQTVSDQTNSSISVEIPHHCVQASSSKQKETKNQINILKLKTCDCKCESKKTLSKGCQCSSPVIAVECNNVSKCEEYRKKMFHARDKEDGNAKECNYATTVCTEYDNEQSKKGRAPMKYSSKDYQINNGYSSSLNQNGHVELCGCSNDCFCENNREPEVQNGKVFCSCHSNGRVQHNGVHFHGEVEDCSVQLWPYWVNNGQINETAQCKVQSNVKCKCEKDCSCNNNRGKTSEEISHGKACTGGKPNYVDEANQTSDSDRNLMAPQIGNDLDQILKDKFTTEFRKEYTTVQGICLPKKYEDFAQIIENFEIRDDDVWICSFPKTGTTWTQEMIWCIANDLDFERAKVRLSERFPFLDYSILFDYTTIIRRHPEIEPSPLILDSVAYIQNLPSPRFIKTHFPFPLLPRQLRTGEKKAKIIYVSRNPKDTCVSFYYHTRLMEGYRGDFHDFCRLFLGNKLSFAPYWDHILDFWKRRTNPNILFLKYEEMKSDLPKVIKKTAAFLDKILTNDQVEALAQHLSFDSMKSNPAVNYEDHIILNKRMKLINVDGEFIRSGKVDQWKEEMPGSVVQEFDETTKEKFSTQNLFF